MKPHEALEHLIETVKGSVDSMRETMAHDDDWLPTAFMVNKGGDLGVVMIDLEFMSSPATKEILATTMLPDVIRKYESIAAGFLATAWQAEYANASEMERTLRPAARPDRREVVMFTACTATEMKAFSAAITRHEDTAPTLDEWEAFPDDSEGLFPMGLRSGLVRQG